MYMCVVRMCVCVCVSLCEGERDREGDRKRGVLRVLDMDGGEDGHSFLSPVTLDPAGLLLSVSQVSHPYICEQKSCKVARRLEGLVLNADSGWSGVVGTDLV